MCFNIKFILLSLCYIELYCKFVKNKVDLFELQIIIKSQIINLIWIIFLKSGFFVINKCI